MGGEDDILKDGQGIDNPDSENSQLELALMSYESGHWFDESDFSNIEDYRLYQSYQDLGPYGFYEEFKDNLDFSKDFIEEYGQ